jgi:hypothetical protein
MDVFILNTFVTVAYLYSQVFRLSLKRRGLVSGHCRVADEQKIVEEKALGG